MTDAPERRVLIVDDHSLFRRGLKELLDDESDLRCVGEAKSSQEAVRANRDLQPDVILLDVHMPKDSGVNVLPQLLKDSDASILMLTVSDKDEDLFAAIKAGAQGYLLKNTEPDDLCKAIRRAADGISTLSPEVTKGVLKAARESRKSSSENVLSARESQVIRLLAQGATTEQIGNHLVISKNTVKTHVRRILGKLEAANRAEAVARAAELGLLKSQ